MRNYISGVCGCQVGYLRMIRPLIPSNESVVSLLTVSSVAFLSLPRSVIHDLSMHAGPVIVSRFFRFFIFELLKFAPPNC